MGYLDILSLEVLKHFEPKIFKDFKLYQVFLYNFSCSIDLNVLTKKLNNFYPKMFQYSRHNLTQGAKCFNTPILYTTNVDC